MHLQRQKYYFIILNKGIVNFTVSLEGLKEIVESDFETTIDLLKRTDPKHMTCALCGSSALQG